MTDPAPPAAAMWDERYRPAAYAYGLEPNAFLASQAHRLKAGMRALVPGDGEGRNGVWLAGQGLEVDAFDLSAVGVAKAKALAAERGASIAAFEADASRGVSPRSTPRAPFGWCQTPRGASATTWCWRSTVLLLPTSM